MDALIPSPGFDGGTVVLVHRQSSNATRRPSPDGEAGPVHYRALGHAFVVRNEVEEVEADLRRMLAPFEADRGTAGETTYLLARDGQGLFVEVDGKREERTGSAPLILDYAL